MKRVIFWTVPAAFLLAIFQTAVLSHIRFFQALPDFILLLVIYAAFSGGTIEGVISGFLAGLLFDFLSLSPFGLHAFIFTALGFVYGLFHEKYNVRVVIFLCAFGFLGTVLKAVLFILLHFLFGSVVHVYDFHSGIFWFETGLNTLLAPLFFFLCRLFHSGIQKD